MRTELLDDVLDPEKLIAKIDELQRERAAKPDQGQLPEGHYDALKASIRKDVADNRAPRMSPTTVRRGQARRASTTLDRRQ
jgi:hypothetical protein